MSSRFESRSSLSLTTIRTERLNADDVTIMAKACVEIAQGIGRLNHKSRMESMPVPLKDLSTETELLAKCLKRLVTPSTVTTANSTTNSKDSNLKVTMMDRIHQGGKIDETIQGFLQPCKATIQELSTEIDKALLKGTKKEVSTLANRAKIFTLPFKSKRRAIELALEKLEAQETRSMPRDIKGKPASFDSTNFSIPSSQSTRSNTDSTGHGPLGMAAPSRQSIESSNWSPWSLPTATSESPPRMPPRSSYPRTGRGYPGWADFVTGPDSNPVTAPSSTGTFAPASEPALEPAPAPAQASTTIPHVTPITASIPTAPSTPPPETEVAGPHQPAAASPPSPPTVTFQLPANSPSSRNPPISSKITFVTTHTPTPLPTPTPTPSPPPTAAVSTPSNNINSVVASIAIGARAVVANNPSFGAEILSSSAPAALFPISSASSSSPVPIPAVLALKRKNTTSAIDFSKSNNLSNLTNIDNLSSFGDLEELMKKNSPINVTGKVTFDDTRTFSNGGFACVYSGKMEGKAVAIKVLFSNKTSARKLKREMNVWSALEHTNIVKFYGHASVFEGNHALISEWCASGHAAQYLDAHPELTMKERFSLATDVGEGLTYLHKLRVVHGDLKPFNVLVNDKGIAQLCDFGLVYLLDWEGDAMNTTSPYSATPKYQAPELFNTRSNRVTKPSAAGDVYAFGCIIYEFIDRKEPFANARDIVDILDAIHQRLPPATRSSSSPEMAAETEPSASQSESQSQRQSDSDSQSANDVIPPADVTSTDPTNPTSPPNLTDSNMDKFKQYYWDLLEACWNWTPKNRPSASSVVLRLDDIFQLL